MTNVVLGLFREPQSALAAAGTLKGAGFIDLELMSPIPIEGVEEVLGEKKSVIKRFTLFGGLFGGLFGFAMAAGTAVLYLHPAHHYHSTVFDYHLRSDHLFWHPVHGTGFYYQCA
ncbi:MAG: DUF3341 domain-containing protein, partial [Gammaproteobacteria bacterium]|nr:DUF3341 domain-containing protein [Gammaproteobacteria bacterium]